MALPSSGSISMSQVNVEIKKAAGTNISLNNVDVRKLAGRASGVISMADLRGKSWEIRRATTADAANLNIHEFFGSPSASGSYVFEVNHEIHSVDTGSAALVTGVFPAGSTLTIINNSYIRGAGGIGGSRGAGGDGGTALLVQTSTRMQNNGYIYGGGGGGAGSNGGDTRGFGGGGAGKIAGRGIPRSGNIYGSNGGSLTNGGNGGVQTGTNFGRGGGLGQNGGNGGGNRIRGGGGGGGCGANGGSAVGGGAGGRGGYATQGSDLLTWELGNNTDQVKGAIV